jgi:hypothetical protein
MHQRKLYVARQGPDGPKLERQSGPRANPGVAHARCCIFQNTAVWPSAIVASMWSPVGLAERAREAGLEVKDAHPSWSHRDPGHLGEAARRHLGPRGPLLLSQNRLRQ